MLHILVIHQSHVLICRIFWSHYHVWSAILLNGKAHTWFIDAWMSNKSMKHIWAPLLLEAQHYGTSNAMVRSNMWRNNFRFLNGTATHEWTKFKLLYSTSKLTALYFHTTVARATVCHGNRELLQTVSETRTGGSTLTICPQLPEWTLKTHIPKQSIE